MRGVYHRLRRLRLKEIFWLILFIHVGVGLIGLVFWREMGGEQPVWSWSLGNKVILIDAGHGGVDPGAVSKNKTLEKDINLEIAKRLKILVSQGGGKPVMVREEDIDLGTSSGLLQRKREDLAGRLQLAMDAQADVYLSIHVNSFPDSSLNGPQTFYHAVSPEGKLLAECLQRELNLLSGGKRVIKANQDFFILKKANQAAVTIEVGFISNAKEEQLLMNPDYQEKLAWAIYTGLCQYFSQPGYTG